MKKFLFALTLALLFCLTALAVSAKEYYIYTPEDMYNVRNDLSGTYYLMNDIDLSCYENWEPIGNEEMPFSGTFDGKNYDIKGLTINTSIIIDNKEDTHYYFGLFGYSKNSNIRKVSLDVKIIINLHSKGGLSNYVGALVGYNYGGTITACSVTGEATSSIVSETFYDFSNPNTKADNYVGGLIAENNGGRVFYCSSKLNINSSAIATKYKANNYVGGLVAVNTWGTIKNCYSNGSIYLDLTPEPKEDVFIGGLIGVNYGDWNQKQIYNCYSINSIILKDDDGKSSNAKRILDGIIGENSFGLIHYCYSIYEFTKLYKDNTTEYDSNMCIFYTSYTDEVVRKNIYEMCTDLTSIQIKDASNFTDFDFQNTWAIDPGINEGYPYLLPYKEDNDEIKVYVNNSIVTFDVPPTIIDGRTLVPLRAIFEALGATIEWDGATQTITGTKDSTTIIMVVGQTDFTVNGVTKTLDVPPQIIDSRTLVPARAIAESFGVNVAWNGEERAVYIG